MIDIQSFMIYMVNCIVFFCGLFLLFAGIEWLENKISKLIKKKKVVCRRKVEVKEKQSHFYNFIIE